MPGNDRISEFPENLITQILSYLPTKDSVKTSVLSTRWKNRWLNVPGLDLDCSDFPYKEDQVLFNLVDTFLEFNRELRLQKVKVKFRDEKIDGMEERIFTAIDRGVQHLDVEGSLYYVGDDDGMHSHVDFMPLNLYTVTSKTLVSLKLLSLGLPDPGFVSMPCLKFMYLGYIMWSGTSMNLEKLISGCPVLEELTLLRDMFDSYSRRLRDTCVRSRSLKRFCVPPESGIFRGESGVVLKSLDIDAPGLDYMSIKEDHFHRCVFSRNFYPEEEISKSQRNEIYDFLTGISGVRHMIISQNIVKALDRYSNVGLIPNFSNLSRLEAVFPCALLRFLPAFLESFPNLKHLILKVVCSIEIELFEPIDVPRCFLSSLECKAAPRQVREQIRGRKRGRETAKSKIRRSGYGNIV